MKQTSIEKLSSIYNYLVTSERPDLAQLCTEIFRAEQESTKKGKFNIYNYVENDKKRYREVLKGVFHDEGNMVATDAHIMVVIKEKYPEELEGKIILSNGSFVDTANMHMSYPKWKSVIPKPEGYQPYRVDAKMFYEHVEKERAMWKALYGKNYKWTDRWNVKVGPSVLRAELFDKFLMAMDKIGANEIFVKDRSHAVYSKTDKGLVLPMPVMIDSEQDAGTPYKLA